MMISEEQILKEKTKFWATAFRVDVEYDRCNRHNMCSHLSLFTLHFVRRIVELPLSRFLCTPQLWQWQSVHHTFSFSYCFNAWAIPALHTRSDGNDHKFKTWIELWTSIIKLNFVEAAARETVQSKIGHRKRRTPEEIDALLLNERIYQISRSN